MIIEEPAKYDFLALVALEESDDESCKEKVALRTKAKSDNCMLQDSQENLLLMPAAGSYNKDSGLLDTKVCFEQATANIHIYS